MMLTKSEVLMLREDYKQKLDEETMLLALDLMWVQEHLAELKLTKGEPIDIFDSPDQYQHLAMMMRAFESAKERYESCEEQMRCLDQLHSPLLMVLDDTKVGRR